MSYLLNPFSAFATGIGGGGHRYWRLLIYMNGAGSGFTTIGEIELRASLGGSDETGSGTASANGTSGGTNAGQAFDNNTGTSWNSASGGFPQWIKYDFGSGNNKNIVQVAITARSSTPTECVRDFDVQWSDDDSAWTTVFSIFGEFSWTTSEQRIYTSRTAQILYDYAGVTDAYDILGANLKGWYNADLLTGSNGDAKQMFPDSSSYGYYLWNCLSSGSHPTLEAAHLNSMNTLRFNYANANFYNIPRPVHSGASALSMYIVFKSLNDPSVTVTDSGIAKIGNSANVSHWPYTDGTVYDDFGSTVRHTTGNPTLSLSSAYRIISVHSAASSYNFYIDGTLHHTDTSNTVGLSLIPIFGQSDGNTRLNGYVAEVIFTDSNDSTGTRQQIEGYLAHKWFGAGSSNNLPYTHPYKGPAPGGAWAISAQSSVAGNSTIWNGYTHRQLIGPSALSNTGGSHVRLTLIAGTSVGATIDGVYIGHAAASGDVYDFETTPTQVLFSGSGSVSIGAGATTVSDAVAFSIDGSKTLLISVHFSGSSNISVEATRSGWTEYNKAAVSEAATVNVSGYSAGASAAYLISKVESYS